MYLIVAAIRNHSWVILNPDPSYFRSIRCIASPARLTHVFSIKVQLYADNYYETVGIMGLSDIHTNEDGSFQFGIIVLYLISQLPAYKVGFASYLPLSYFDNNIIWVFVVKHSFWCINFSKFAYLAHQISHLAIFLSLANTQGYIGHKF